MTLQLVVIVSSVVGALLFFLSGYFMARSVRAAEPNPQVATPDRSSGQVGPKADAPSTPSPESTAVDARASLERNALLDEIQACRSSLAEAEQEQRAKLAALEGENKRLMEEKQQLLAQIEEAMNPLELQTWKEKARQADDLKEEKADLNRRLQQALEKIRLLQEQTVRLEELEHEQQESTLKIETLGRQVAALERCKEENTRLTKLVEEFPHMLDTVDRLKAENRELRSLGLAYQPPPPTTQTTPPEHLGSSMQYLLERLSETEGARGAALADEQGLPIAGTSQYTEGLSVTASLCDSLMKQVTGILPLTTLSRLVMVDPNSNTVAIHPFQAGSDRFLLATLSVESGLDSEVIDHFIDQVSLLMDGDGKGAGEVV